MGKVRVGVSQGFHDTVTILDGQDIMYASHSERYSRKENDKWIRNDQLIEWDDIAYYERPFLKNSRRFLVGQKMQWTKFRYDHYFGSINHVPFGFRCYTSPFKDCNIIVVDAIGEWDPVSIWRNMKKIKSWKYPYSLGLLYSAITHRIGLK